MDNSISKALIMVASVLLAMVVIAFITFSFRRMGTWASAQNDELLIEQKQKFNKEYEAFDKSLMYGVDIISCLNKSKSNNDAISGKYAEAKDSIYEVKVKVKLKKDNPLEESITVYYIDERTKKELGYPTDQGPKKNGTSQKYKLSDMVKKFNFLSKKYSEISSFNLSSELKTQNAICNKLKNVKELNITVGENGTNEDETRKLLSLSDTVSEIIKNTDSKTNNTKEGWTKAEFKSALYDLKTRKFKCEKIEYSEYGIVNYIEFKEL